MILSFGNVARAMVGIAAVVFAFGFPALGEGLFRRIENAATAFARRRWLCCFALGLAVLLFRAVLLPIWEIPKPYIYDEFGYILQADTFSSGRLSNPAHPLWQFFESPYILARPSYNAKFPPGQGLMMAVGQMLLGDPWFGVWLSCGVLAALLFWALREWLPPGWALLGSVLTLPLVLTSYWMDSYWGGAVAAIGGVLVIGAVPGFKSRPALSATILGSGIVILMATRPFEGFLLLLPVGGYLLFQKVPWKAWSVVAIITMLGAGWIGYYNQRVTGSALRLPYVEYDRQYPSTPHFNFLPLPAPAQFVHADFKMMDTWERAKWARSRTPGFLSDRAADVAMVLGVMFGNALILIPVVLFWPQLLKDKRLRLHRWCLGGLALTVVTEVVYYTHYAAPFLAVIVIVAAQSFRHLRLWTYKGRPTGRALSRGMVAALLVLWAGHEGLRIAQRRPVGDAPANTKHKVIEESLQERGGEHLILVRYTRNFETLQAEWIYNHADIDNSPVIWAQDMGPEENRRLITYLKGRTVWQFLPDEDVTKLSPYDAGNRGSAR